MAERHDHPPRYGAEAPAAIELGALPIPALVLGASGRIEAANPHAAQVLGQEPEALWGLPWRAVLRPVDVPDWDPHAAAAASLAASPAGAERPPGVPRSTSVTFFEWVIVTMPLTAVMLGLCWTLLRWRYPAPSGATQDVRPFVQRARSDLGGWTKAQRNVAAVFGLAGALWMLPAQFRWQPAVSPPPPCGSSLVSLNRRSR